MEVGATPNLATIAALVDELVLAPVELDDPGALHALPQVLVRGADDDLLDLGCQRQRPPPRWPGVVGLDIDLGQTKHPEGGQ